MGKGKLTEDRQTEKLPILHLQRKPFRGQGSCGQRLGACENIGDPSEWYLSECLKEDVFIDDVDHTTLAVRSDGRGRAARTLCSHLPDLYHACIPDDKIERKILNLCGNFGDCKVRELPHSPIVCTGKALGLQHKVPAETDPGGEKQEAVNGQH
ncbi:Atpase Wrnip1 [Manis pentadactyla]|nr:Atpase Wrnip1 [Manis pentadactyla]